MSRADLVFAVVDDFSDQPTRLSDLGFDLGAVLLNFVFLLCMLKSVEVCDQSNWTAVIGSAGPLSK